MQQLSVKLFSIESLLLFLDFQKRQWCMRGFWISEKAHYSLDQIAWRLFFVYLSLFSVIILFTMRTRKANWCVYCICILGFSFLGENFHLFFLFPLFFLLSLPFFLDFLQHFQFFIYFPWSLLKLSMAVLSSKYTHQY